MSHHLDAISNIEIDSYLNPFCSYKGCFGIKDEFPRPNRSETIGFFVNLDRTRGGPGTHWVLVLAGPSNSFYFDPFGMPPPTEVIRRFPPTERNYNRISVQGIRKDSCGYYDIYVFLYFMYHGNLDHALNMFTNDTNKNDTILSKFIYSDDVQRLKKLKACSLDFDPSSTSH